MEDSTSTAIYTGAFVLVFVSSLTISLFLFNSILDFSEKAYEYNVNVADNQTIVNAPVGAERLLKPEEVASYYYNYVSHDLYGGDKPTEEYDVRIYISKNETDTSNNKLDENDNYTYKQLMEQLKNKTFILTYKEINSTGSTAKPVIVIKQATPEQINAML